MPKKQSSRRKNSSQLRVQLAVVPAATGWTIKRIGSTQKNRIYATQREAEAAARDMIRSKRGGEVVVHGRNGRIRSVDSYVLGDSAAKVINAIEGIYLTKEMAEDFRELDRRNLSPKQRRDWLLSKYGKSSS